MKKFTIDDVKDQSKIVDINEVCFNPWNPKVKRSKEYEKVKESVRLNGLAMPIIVREIDDENFKYQVLDGEQRLTAMLDLGFEQVWIVDLGEVSDEEAKAKTIWMEQAVPFDQEKLNGLLVELIGQVELPYTGEEIELMSGIKLLDDEGEDEFEDDTMTLVSFGVNVLPDNKQWLKDTFKELREELNCSDNAIIMIAMQLMKNEDKVDGHFEELLEAEKQKEFEFGV